MYRQEEPPRDRLLAEIFNAAQEYPSGLTDSSVQRIVNALVAVPEQPAFSRQDPTTAARDAVSAAREASLELGAASFFGDLADRAAHATIVAAQSRPDLLHSPPTILETFASQLVGLSIGHLVARDLSGEVGTRSLPDVADGLALRRDLVSRARAIVGAPRVQEAIEAAASNPERRWRSVVDAMWTEGRDPKRTA